MRPALDGWALIGNGLKPVLLLVALCVSAIAAEPTGTLLTHTGTEKRDLVCPDAESLVYCEQINPYQLGLMQLSLKDGTITRLHPDFRTNEFEPAFSAAWKTIAFTSNCDGNYEIYTLPMTGGTPTRGMTTLRGHRRARSCMSRNSRAVRYPPGVYHAITIAASEMCSRKTHPEGGGWNTNLL